MSERWEQIRAELIAAHPSGGPTWADILLQRACERIAELEALLDRISDACGVEVEPDIPAAVQAAFDQNERRGHEIRRLKAELELVTSPHESVGAIIKQREAKAAREALERAAAHFEGWISTRITVAEVSAWLRRMAQKMN